MKKQIISAFITLLVAFVAWIMYVKFFATRYNNYIVYYTDVKGVQESSPVLLHGVRIGKIENITIENSGLVKIIIQVTQDVTIHKGAVAELKSSGLIGNKSITIIDGSSNLILSNGGVIFSDTSDSSTEKTTNTDTIKNQITNADSALRYIRDSSHLLSAVGNTFATFEKNMKSYVNTSKKLVTKVNNAATTIGNVSASASKLNTRSSSFPDKTKKLVQKTNNINQSGIKDNIDTFRQSVNTLVKAIQDAKSITTDSKTYINTSKNIESLSNETKDYYNHPKGFSILGKSKKKK